ILTARVECHDAAGAPRARAANRGTDLNGLVARCTRGHVQRMETLHVAPVLFRSREQVHRACRRIDDRCGRDADLGANERTGHVPHGKRRTICAGEVHPPERRADHRCVERIDGVVFGRHEDDRVLAFARNRHRRQIEHLRIDVAVDRECTDLAERGGVHRLGAESRLVQVRTGSRIVVLRRYDLRAARGRDDQCTKNGDQPIGRHQRFLPPPRAGSASLNVDHFAMVDARSYFRSRFRSSVVRNISIRRVIFVKPTFDTGRFYRLEARRISRRRERVTAITRPWHCAVERDCPAPPAVLLLMSTAALKPTGFFHSITRLVPAVASTVAALATVMSFLFSSGFVGRHMTGGLRASWIALNPLVDSSYALGDTIHLAATITDQNGAVILGARPTWTSENPSVVKVESDGTVIVKTPGTATIIAAVDSRTARAHIFVRQRVASVRSARDSTVFVPEGEQRAVSIFAFDARGHIVRGRPVVWASDDTTIATVDSSGLVTGGTLGHTLVHATIDGFAAAQAITVFATP